MKDLKDLLNEETQKEDTVEEFLPEEHSLDIMDDTLADLIHILAKFTYEGYDVYETNGAMHLIPIDEQHELTGCCCHPFVVNHEGEEGKVIYIHNIRQ